VQKKLCVFVYFSYSIARLNNCHNAALRAVSGRVARVEPEFGSGRRSYLAHRVDANGEVRMVWRLNCMSRALSSGVHY
jgi:hypothetical protein